MYMEQIKTLKINFSQGRTNCLFMFVFSNAFNVIPQQISQFKADFLNKTKEVKLQLLHGQQFITMAINNEIQLGISREEEEEEDERSSCVYLIQNGYLTLIKEIENSFDLYNDCRKAFLKWHCNDALAREQQRFISQMQQVSMIRKREKMVHLRKETITQMCLDFSEL